MKFTPEYIDFANDFTMPLKLLSIYIFYFIISKSHWMQIIIEILFRHIKISLYIEMTFPFY